jgi:hypothetical protein
MNQSINQQMLYQYINHYILPSFCVILLKKKRFKKSTSPPGGSPGRTAKSIINEGKMILLNEGKLM